MKMAVLNVFANLDFSWHQMGVTAKVCAIKLEAIFFPCFFFHSIFLRDTTFPYWFSAFKVLLVWFRKPNWTSLSPAIQRAVAYAQEAVLTSERVFGLFYRHLKDYVADEWEAKLTVGPPTHVSIFLKKLNSSSSLYLGNNGG